MSVGLRESGSSSDSECWKREMWWCIMFVEKCGVCGGVQGGAYGCVRGDGGVCSMARLNNVMSTLAIVVKCAVIFFSFLTATALFQ